MAGAKLPPRQRMINLLYVILIAMLAINISADTLDTYSLLDKGVSSRLSALEPYYGEMFDEAVSLSPGRKNTLTAIDSMAKGLIRYIDDIKEEIAKAADKKKYTSADELKAMEELNAVPDVMLSAVNPRGAKLREALVEYHDTLVANVPGGTSVNMIDSYLSLGNDKPLMSWEKAVFTSMPAIGGMVYMNILQENILLSAIEAYRGMKSPASAYEKSGDIAAADDSSECRYVLINDSQKIVDRDGTIEVPVVHVTPHIESVLYAGYDNPVDVLAIGISPLQIEFKVKGGTWWLDDGMLYVRPAKGASEVVLDMGYVKGSEYAGLGSKTFVVKQLPLPVPYVALDGGGMYTGAVPVSKDRIMSALYVGASIKEPVEIDYEICGFELVLIKSGSRNVVSAFSDGPELTGGQRKILESAENGDKIYFTGISARIPKGEDVLDLPPVSAPVYE